MTGNILLIPFQHLFLSFSVGPVFCCLGAIYTHISTPLTALLSVHLYKRQATAITNLILAQIKQYPLKSGKALL